MSIECYLFFIGISLAITSFVNASFLVNQYKTISLTTISKLHPFHVLCSNRGIYIYMSPLPSFIVSCPRNTISHHSAAPILKDIARLLVEDTLTHQQPPALTWPLNEWSKWFLGFTQQGSIRSALNFKQWTWILRWNTSNSYWLPIVVCGGSLEKIAFGHRQFQSTLHPLEADTSHHTTHTNTHSYTTHSHQIHTTWTINMCGSVNALNHPRWLLSVFLIKRPYQQDGVVETKISPFILLFVLFLFILCICAVCWLCLMDFCVRVLSMFFVSCPHMSCLWIYMSTYVCASECVTYVFTHFVLSMQETLYMRNQCTSSLYLDFCKKVSISAAFPLMTHLSLLPIPHPFPISTYPAHLQYTHTHTNTSSTVYRSLSERRSVNWWKLDSWWEMAVNARIRKRRH